MFRKLLFILLANLSALAYCEVFQSVPDNYKAMLEKEYSVLGIGASCVDFLIQVDDNFIKANIFGEKGGSTLIDYDSLNRIIELSPTVPKVATGGSCANVIKSLAMLGDQCALLGHHGPDAAGDYFIDYMNKIGVIGFYTKSTQPTSRAICLTTPDGQRTMRFFPGSSREMDATLLHPDYFKNAKIMHIESYLFRNDNLIETAMQHAKEAGILVSIDLSSFEIVRQYKEQILKLIAKYVDIVFANEFEAQELMGVNPEEACLKLQEMCPIAVVSLGEHGCVVGSQGRLIKSPAFITTAIDTTGAGDVFSAGFLHTYLQGKSLEECARFGNRVGSAVVEVIGTELSPERWEALRLQD